MLQYLAQLGNFWTGFGIAAAGWIIPLIVGIVSIFAFMYLSKQSKDKVNYAKQSLTLIKVFLGRRLGTKASAVIDAWLQGIKLIEDGSFSKEDGVDQFLSFVVIAAQNNGVTFTEDEINAIKEAIIDTLNLIDTKAKPTQKAVSIMMIESK